MHRTLALALALATASAAWAHPGITAELENLESRFAQAPGDVELHLRRAELLRRSAAHARALVALEEAGRLAPQDPRVALERGLNFASAGLSRAAALSLDAALAALPDSAIGWSTRARLHAEAGELAPAIAAYGRALRLQPEPDHFLERGRLQEKVNDKAGAAATYGEGLARLGDSVVLREALVRVELSRGRPEAALAALEPALAAAPVKTEWLLRRAEIHQAAGAAERARADRAWALAEAERALAQRPTPQRLAARDLALEALGRSPPETPAPAIQVNR